MPALVAGIHALKRATHEDVDGRDTRFARPGHDELIPAFVLPQIAGALLASGAAAILFAARR